MTHWTEGIVTIDSVTLAYLRSDAGGPPVVCAHGLTDSARCWTRLAQVLTGQGYNVIAYDARGHGQSTAPTEGYTASAHSADLVGLIQTLGLDRPILLGHSMGAHVCALAAAHHPTLCHTLILEDPPWRDVPRQFSAEEMTEMCAWLHSTQHLSNAEIIATEGANVNGWDARELQPWLEAKRQARPDVFGWFAEPPTWREILSSLAIPTLLLRGDSARGAIVTPEVVAEAQHCCAHLRVAPIHGAGHNIRRDRFADYSAAVQAFLADQTRS